MIRPIALTGPMGVGKSTLAQVLLAAIPLHLFAERWSFAGPLRDAVAAIFGSRYASQAEKAAADPYWSRHLGARWGTGRAILQQFGTDVCRAGISPDIWLLATERRLQLADAERSAATVAVFDDCRFPNEAAFIRARGGVVAHLERPGIGWTGGHASEQPLPREPGDLVLDLGRPELTAAAVARILNHPIITRT